MDKKRSNDLFQIKTDNSKPVVSVITAVYNRKKLFERAYNSIINQTFSDYEIIIIDDGSTDGFAKEIVNKMKYNTKIKYLKHSNRGTALSLNTGIILAQGDYITFLDSDDEYLQDHISSRVKYLRQNKNIDLLHSPAMLIGKQSDFFVTDARNSKNLIHLDKCIIGATFFGKREVFLYLKGFKNIFSYDSDFYKRAKKIFNIEKFNLRTYKYYRNTKDSILTIIKKNAGFI